MIYNIYVQEIYIFTPTFLINLVDKIKPSGIDEIS